MKKYIIFFVIIIFWGCDMQNKELNGFIYWGGGHNKIYKTNLKTRKTEIIFISKKRSYIGNFILDGTDIIFDDTRSNIIRKYNLISNNDAIIAKGYLPTYIKRNNILFYIRGKEGLIQKNLTNGVEKLVLKNLPDYGGIEYRNKEIYSLCLISDEEIAIDYNIKNTIVIYNLKKNSFHDLGLRNYSLGGYCSLNNSLILRMNYSFTYLYNLDDKSFKKLKIKRPKASCYFIYIPELNGFFYLKMRFPAFIGQIPDLWFYDFETRKEKKIVKMVFMRNLYYSKNDILSEIKGKSRDSEINKMKKATRINPIGIFQKIFKKNKKKIAIRKEIKKKIKARNKNNK